MNRLSSLRILPLAVLLAVGGCGDSSPSGPDLTFDPAPVEDLLRAHVATFQTTYGANVFLAVALQDLESLGVSFEPMDLGPVLSPRVVLPAEMLGATFVYDGAENMWVVDDAATGAPEDGIRITWYALDGARFPITSQVLGYIDLTDEDGDGLSRLGVTIVYTLPSEPRTLSVYEVGFAATSEIETTERFEASGWVENDARRLQFDLRGAETVNQDTGDEILTTTMHVTGPDGSYDLDLDRAVDGATATRQESWLVTVEQGGATTELSLELTGPEDDPDLAGTIRHAGQLVARLAGESGDAPEYTTADGERYSGSAKDRLESLVATMATTALYYLANAFPVLYLR